MTLKDIAVQAFEHFTDIEILEKTVLITYDSAEYFICYYNFFEHCKFSVNYNIGIVPYAEPCKTLNDCFKFIKNEN